MKNFNIGDIIKISFQEGKRIQFNKGIIIGIRDSKIIMKTFGAERIFPYFHPQIKTLQVLKSQKYRRSKLYYLR